MGDPGKAESVEKAVSSAAPWPKQTTSDARRNWVEHHLKQKADAAPKPPSAQDDKRTVAQHIITDTAAKIKGELEEKERKAAAKQLDLVREAAVEYLRMEFGKKQRPPFAREAAESVPVLEDNGSRVAQGHVQPSPPQDARAAPAQRGPEGHGGHAAQKVHVVVAGAALGGLRPFSCVSKRDTREKVLLTPRSRFLDSKV